MDFYAFLPSNASPDLYADNTTSHFKIQMARRLDLHGKWKVALVQAHYPNTIAQVSEGENKMMFLFRDGREKTYILKEGYYAHPKDFLFALHESIAPMEVAFGGHGRKSVVDINQESRIMFYPFNPDLGVLSYTFSPRLAMQLGLEHPGPYLASEELCASYPIDLNLGVPPMLFVYLDKLSEQIVGQCNAPLLATVPTSINQRYGSVTAYTFDQPLYLDLATKNFDTIEINIRDHTGKYVAFNHGTAMLLCHFKQVL